MQFVRGAAYHSAEVAGFLEKDDLVQRMPSPTDRRIIMVELTTKHVKRWMRIFQKSLMIGVPRKITLRGSKNRWALKAKERTDDPTWLDLRKRNSAWLFDRVLPVCFREAHVSAGIP